MLLAPQARLPQHGSLDRDDATRCRCLSSQPRRDRLDEQTWRRADARESCEAEGAMDVKQDVTLTQLFGMKIFVLLDFYWRADVYQHEI